MTKVVLAEIPECAGRDLDLERSILGPDVELAHYLCDGDEDRLAAACRHADAVLTDYSPFTARVIKQLLKCRVISVTATGFDSIDLEAAADSGIRVCAIDEYCTEEVADHALLLMLALCRRLPEYHEQVQREKRWQFDSMDGLARMRDLTLGVIGFGRIGQAVAKRARGFGLNILAYDPYPNESVAAEFDVRFCDLPALYAAADIISLNCNLANDGTHLLDADAFQQMKQNPLLIIAHAAH